MSNTDFASYIPIPISTMETIRAETLLRLIKTTLAVVPSIRDEIDLFMDTDDIVSQLIRWFQQNPLFTPEFATEHPEIMIIPKHIATNPSWSLEDVVSYAIASGATDQEAPWGMRNFRYQSPAMNQF